MNLRMRDGYRLMALAALWMTALTMQAAEAVYRIVEYNKTTGEFELAASGMVPKGSWVYFENEYGATTGNRYNQIPRNRQATLYLEGWQGCTVRSITLSMCSNRKAGQAGLSLTDGKETIYQLRPCDFASREWFGQWVNKDLGVYVDVTKPMEVPALTCDEAAITLKGGTSEGSVYVNSITIEYDEPAGMQLESPLGWIYEKLEKKSTLKAGDELMIFRNGCAAADIDGIETSHYLDAVPLASTTDVTNHEVLRFTLAEAETAGMWTLTDQHGRQLAASGKQALAWNNGVTDWKITLGYEGASITSANEKYGTMRFNAPVESYARFNLYTSTSLPLPFLYRKKGQKEPQQARSLAFEESEMTVCLDDRNMALRPTLTPASPTDKRIAWSSSNEQVATVNGGFVTLLSQGETTITAHTKDGAATATLRLIVTGGTGIASATATNKQPTARKQLSGHNIIIQKGTRRYSTAGAAL